MLLVLGTSQNSTWPAQWQVSKWSLALNIEAVCTCERLAGCLQAQSLCCCLFGRFEAKVCPLCTRSHKVSQPAEEGWMLYVKFPSHSSVAWMWWVTYSTYLKPLRDPDGLTGPEASPLCWSWSCRWAWARRARSSSSGHLSSSSLPQHVRAGRLMWSHMAHNSGHSQSKSLSGVQGSSPTHPPSSLSTHWIYSWDKSLGGCWWEFHSLLTPQWLFLTQPLVFWAALGTYRPPPTDHICPQRVRKEMPQ